LLRLALASDDQRARDERAAQQQTRSAEGGHGDGRVQIPRRQQADRGQRRLRIVPVTVNETQGEGVMARLVRARAPLELCGLGRLAPAVIREQPLPVEDAFEKLPGEETVGWARCEVRRRELEVDQPAAHDWWHFRSGGVF